MTIHGQQMVNLLPVFYFATLALAHKVFKTPTRCNRLGFSIKEMLDL